MILGANYGTAVDMWSLGCIAAELVTGRPLFAGDDESDQLISQLEYLGMPPDQLLARSTRATDYFSTSTDLPRYCSYAVKSEDTARDVDSKWIKFPSLPIVVGSKNKAGKYRCPPGSMDLDARLLDINGRGNCVMDRRHRVRPYEDY